MRYCGFCKRMNPDKPLYCQFCGRTFGVKVCKHCREVNPLEALRCRKCGSSELSDPSGPSPSWPVYLNVLCGILAFILIIGLIRNLELLLPLFVVIGLLCLGFLFMPPIIRKLLQRVLGYLWGVVITGKRNRR